MVMILASRRLIAQGPASGSAVRGRGGGGLPVTGLVFGHKLTVWGTGNTCLLFAV
jgi:hypothetical protein